MAFGRIRCIVEELKDDTERIPMNDYDIADTMLQRLKELDFYLDDLETELATIKETADSAFNRVFDDREKELRWGKQSTETE